MRAPQHHLWATTAVALLVAAGGSACKKESRATPSVSAPPAPPATSLPLAAPAPVANDAAVASPPSGSSPFDQLAALPLKTLSGNPITLGAYRGKALLLVNVASQCGLTPQYAALEALQKMYGAQGFSVIGFPSNQFGGQEPGTAEEIATFCSSKYGVTFPLMEKIEVNGPGAHGIYKILTAIADPSGYKGDIRWNFEKFVVSADGQEIVRFAPKTTPDDPAVLAAIKIALPRK